MHRKKFSVAVIALSLLALVAAYRVGAAGPNDTRQKSKLDSLAWMVGAWRSAPGTSLVEEHWSRDVNGAMLGMCRLGDDPKRATYELILIEALGDEIVMSVRHFGAGLAGKEGHDGKFKLTKQSDKEATFEYPKVEFPRRLVYRQTGAKSLLIRLEGTNKGKPASKDLNLHRVEDSE